MRYNGIGDLIDENIELKRKLRKQTINGLKSSIIIFKNIFPEYKTGIKINGLNITQYIEEMETKLNKYLDGEQ